VRVFRSRRPRRRASGPRTCAQLPLEARSIGRTASAAEHCSRVVVSRAAVSEPASAARELAPHDVELELRGRSLGRPTPDARRVRLPRAFHRGSRGRGNAWPRWRPRSRRSSRELCCAPGRRRASVEIEQARETRGEALEVAHRVALGARSERWERDRARSFGVRSGPPGRGVIQQHEVRRRFEEGVKASTSYQTSALKASER